MAYMALYRKWRPDEFDEVKGQDHIVTTLKNQIVNNRIGHAYLFCGTRGTGKTTIAKLFAKAVNCEHPINGNPCKECETCKAIAEGTSMNVMEIDAASNNGVDNIRQLREDVGYPPTKGKYKVYIIDEVHMLSIGAFNALLKTLEEPPSYVIFILATTESHKIPITISSRCQRYDFRRISVETISERLTELLRREQIEAEDKAINYIAKAADGSMRDSLSILDQCIAFNLGKKLTYENILETIGAVDIDVFANLLEKVIKLDVAGAVDLVDEIIWQGRELGRFVNEFTWFIRNILIVKVSPEGDKKLDMTEDNLKRINAIADTIDVDTLMRYINVFSETSANIKYAAQKRVVLELAIIRLCKPQMETSYEDILDRLRVLEKKIEDGNFISAVTANSISVPANSSENQEKTSIDDAEERSQQMMGRLKNELQEADYNELRDFIQQWPEITADYQYITRKYIKCATVNLADDKKGLLLTFVDDPKYKNAIDYFKDKSHMEILKQYIKDKTGRKADVTLRVINKTDAIAQDVAGTDLSKVKYNIEYK